MLTHAAGLISLDCVLRGAVYLCNPFPPDWIKVHSNLHSALGPCPGRNCFVSASASLWGQQRVLVLTSAHSHCTDEGCTSVSTGPRGDPQPIPQALRSWGRNAPRLHLLELRDTVTCQRHNPEGWNILTNPARQAPRAVLYSQKPRLRWT